MKTLLFIIFVSLLTSCASLNFPPAPTQLDKIKTKVGKLDQKIDTNSKDILWATLFLNAQYFENKGKRAQACEFFSLLEKETEFPLAPLAKLKKSTNCKLTTEQREQFWIEGYKTSPYWLREFFAKESLAMAKKLKNKKFVAHFSALYAKFLTIQDDKVLLIKKAIKLAPAEDKNKYVEQLYRTAPHHYPKPTDENIFTIAKDYEKNRKFRSARKLYWKIVKSDRFDFKKRSKAFDRIRLSYKLQRDTKNYLKYTKRRDRFIRRSLHQDYTNSELQKAWLDSQITLARLYWTEDNARKARVILYSLLKKEISFVNFEGRIYHILAGISVEEKKYTEAIELLGEAKKSNIESPDLKDKINWGYAWNQYLQKNYSISATAFESAIKESENYFFKIKCSFWEARSYVASGDKDSGNELLNEIAEVDSFGYYGIMAHRELKKPFSSLSHQYENSNTVRPQLPIFEWLIAMNNHKLAKKYLRQHSNKLFKDKNEIEASLLLYAKAHDYTWPIHQFYRIKPPLREDTLSRKAYLVFPSPFKNQFEKVAKRFRHTSYYLYSIARQESAFDPEARSPAEAYGLMQLIPKRAVELSRKFNVRYSVPKDLYRPNTNIFMGAALLRRLKKDLKNRFVLTTASYNAKISAVRRWYRRRFDGDYIKFIEMIPYSETQGYVKLVIRNFITYNRLSSSSKFLFPEKLFTGDY